MVLGILELIFVLFHLFREPTSTIKIASCGFPELSVSYFNNSVISSLNYQVAAQLLL